MRKYWMFSAFAMVFLSCSSEETLQEVKVDNRYTISIPSFLNKASDLNEDASLQYMNESKEYYVIVIDEDKEEFHEAINTESLSDQYSQNLDGYANLLIDNFGYSAKIKSKTKISETTIHGMPARWININASFDGVDVFCSLSYLEGKSSYYQVFAWTLLEKEKQFKSSLNAIAQTLQEI